jgi:hypothetical protein
MFVTREGITARVKPEQPENAEEPMLVTLVGFVTSMRLEQSWKAAIPMI